MSERELVAGGHSADVEQARARVSTLLAKAHDPTKPVPQIKAMEVAMAVVPGKPYCNEHCFEAYTTSRDTGGN